MQIQLQKDSLELCSKLQIWYVSTHTYVVLENIPFSTKTTLILLMSAFIIKNITFTQGISMRAALEILQFRFQLL